jgi:rfaE bifunctional protein nucleotidyltransferase chain/domain
MTEKILSTTEATLWVRRQHEAGLRVGFTCGAFDLLHAGHVDYLQRARALCDRLLVAVNSDASIRGYKDPLRPLIAQDQRLQVVAALAAVDAVTLLDDVRPASLIERLRPDLYIKGGDYSVEKLRSRTAVEAYGGQAVVIPIKIAASTSSILERAAALYTHAPPLGAAPTGRRLVFLDRDGTLIRNVPFLHEPARVELLTGVGEGLAELERLGFRLVLVTNQQGIGLGYYGMDAMMATNQALFKALAPFGVRIARVYFCPHSLADDCTCRKPAPALLETALRENGADPRRCYLIGDSPGDIEAGHAAGIPSFQVGEGSGMSFPGAVARIMEVEKKA